MASRTPNHAGRPAALFGPGDHDGADDAHGLPSGIAANRGAHRLCHRSARPRSQRAGLLDTESSEQNTEYPATAPARGWAVASWSTALA